jgi:putative transposase
MEGGTYFFTVVTYQRQKILASPENIEFLRDSFRKVIEEHPFTIDGFVALPDHLHYIWTLPKGDSDFATRWRLIKSTFSRKCSWGFPQETEISRMKKGERTIWQRRYWEHVIKDDLDFGRHMEYIHYNPVKHGLVSAPRDWPYSSFHRYVRAGVCDPNWGASVFLDFDPIIGKE